MSKLSPGTKPENSRELMNCLPEDMESQPSFGGKKNFNEILNNIYFVLIKTPVQMIKLLPLSTQTVDDHPGPGPVFGSKVHRVP